MLGEKETLAQDHLNRIFKALIERGTKLIVFS